MLQKCYKAALYVTDMLQVCHEFGLNVTLYVTEMLQGCPVCYNVTCVQAHSQDFPRGVLIRGKSGP